MWTQIQAHIMAGADPLELELQAIMSCPRWVLEIALGSSIRAVGAFNHLAVFIFIARRSLSLKQELTNSAGLGTNELQGTSVLQTHAIPISF